MKKKSIPKLILKIIIGIPVIIILLGLGFWGVLNLLSLIGKTSEKIEAKSRDKEYEKILVEYQRVKPAEFVNLLQNNYRYFGTRYSGYGDKNDDSDEVNGLFELAIEDDTPVFYEIDFYDGEKIVLYKDVFTKFSDELTSRYNNPKEYYYKCEFEGSFGIISCHVDEGGKNYIDHIRLHGNPAMAYKEKDINKIIDTLSNRITEMQIQYTGEYVFEKEEISTSRNKPEDRSFRDEEKAQRIFVTSTGIGNLHAEFISDKQKNDNNYGYNFFIGSNNRKNYNIISQTVWDGHNGSGVIRYYFEDDYIIVYHFEDDGDELSYSMEYKRYFKKRQK